MRRSACWHQKRGSPCRRTSSCCRPKGTWQCRGGAAAGRKGYTLMPTACNRKSVTTRGVQNDAPSEGAFQSAKGGKNHVSEAQCNGDVRNGAGVRSRRCGRTECRTDGKQGR